MPVISAVNKTPNVAKAAPLYITGFNSDKRVSIPPENKMIFNATTPIY